MKKGVNLFGYTRAEIGVGESCRLAAAALEINDVPYVMINFPFCAARQSDESWKHKEVQAPLYNTNIFHINADQLLLGYKHNLIKREHFTDRYNIGVWHWELPEFPDDFNESFDVVDEIWVPTTFIWNAISAKSPVPVIKIPHGITRYPPSALYNRSFFNLPKESFLFLTLYDPCSSQSRKNPMGAIEAFKKSFEKGDLSVGLVIKINNNGLDLTEELKLLNQHIEGYTNIHIINKVISKKEVISLVNSCDALISLHRSEGFGLSLAEAMIAGKPVIATGWSGNADFMNKENSCCISSKLISVGEDWGPYKSHQLWADPDIEEAANYMKRLRDEPHWRQKLAKKGQKTIEEQFSPKLSGKKMLDRLTQLKLL